MSLTLVTYNLYISSSSLIERGYALQQQIIQHKPGIIFLQEVTPAWFQFLIASKFFTTYYHFSKSAISNTFENVTLVYKKYQILHTQQYLLPYTQMNRYYETTEILIGNNHFLLLNTHLDSVFGKKSEVHKLRQLQFLMEKYQDFPNCILGLDSNLINNYTFSKWKDAYLQYQDLYDARPQQFQNTYTYSSKYNKLVSGNYNSRLDRIYFNNSFWKTLQLQLLGYSVAQQCDLSISDHFGLLVVLHL